MHLMNTDLALCIMFAIGLLLGLSISISYRHKARLIERQTDVMIENASKREYEEGYWAGWESARGNRSLIKASYIELFGHLPK